MTGCTSALALALHVCRANACAAAPVSERLHTRAWGLETRTPAWELPIWHCRYCRVSRIRRSSCQLDQSMRDRSRVNASAQPFILIAQLAVAGVLFALCRGPHQHGCTTITVTQTANQQVQSLSTLPATRLVLVSAVRAHLRVWPLFFCPFMSDYENGAFRKENKLGA